MNLNMHYDYKTNKAFAKKMITGTTNYYVGLSKICANCGKAIIGYPAISRKDNKTEICNNCGTLEAVEIAIKYIKLNDKLIGSKVNMLTIIDRISKGTYKCQCECGKVVNYTLSELKRNRSCGCWRKSRDRIDEVLKTMQYVENTSISLIKKTTTNSNNTSGFRGVSYDKTRDKWRAYIKLQYKTKNIGRFNTLEEAIQARLEAEEKYYKPMIDKYKNLNKEV